MVADIGERERGVSGPEKRTVRARGGDAQRCGRLGLSQTEAASLLGVGRNTVNGWVTEEGGRNHRRAPPWLPRMLAVLEAHPEAIETLRGMARG